MSGSQRARADRPAQRRAQGTAGTPPLPRTPPPPPARTPDAERGIPAFRRAPLTASRPWRSAPTELIAKIDAEPTRFTNAVARRAADDQPDEVVPSTRLREKRHRRDRRALLTGKALTLALAALVFLATGAAWGTKAWYDSKFNQIAALDEESTDIKDAPAQLGDENFLIVGSDTREGIAEDKGIGTAQTIKGARSDTVMLAHVPKDRKRAVVVSFPRDLEVTRPECNRWDSRTGEYSDEMVPGADLVKLNSVYAIGGPRCLIKLIQQISGIKFNHFVGVDFDGFKGMVEAVGGITVQADGPIVDTVLGEIATEAGALDLAGRRALNFVRARHVIGDPTSDYGRIKRQQQFISALLNKTMSRDVLLNPTKLTRFVNAFAESTFGDNIGVDQLLTLAQSMKGLSKNRIKFLTVPTTGYANDRGNEVMLPEQAAELFKALIDDSPLPGDEPAAPNAQAQHGTDPQQPPP